MRLPGTLALGILLLSSRAVAGDSQIEDVEIARAAEAYTVETAVLLPTSADRVREILSAPELLPRLNARIRSVEFLSPASAREARVRIVSRRCVLFFCRDYEWVQALRVDSSGDVRVRFEPGESSVNDGEILYRIQPVPGGSARVTVSARIVPAVTLPPLIGPALMRGALADDMTVWSANIVTLARESGVRGRVVLASTDEPAAEARAAPECTVARFC